MDTPDMIAGTRLYTLHHYGHTEDGGNWDRADEQLQVQPDRSCWLWTLPMAGHAHRRVSRPAAAALLREWREESAQRPGYAYLSTYHYEPEELDPWAAYGTEEHEALLREEEEHGSLF